ncbi:N-acetylmuramoyl-L-alanine amidase [Rhizobium leguminosarum bv. viciae]|nr:N-acetylmuramoyl-L-alanine amidase [Rhizobium leguminosarum bv. viciae]
MTINDHFVTGLARKILLHKGGSQIPRLIVVHYSVTNTVAEAVAALNSEKLSYHILIEKDGTAFQTRGFNESAAHAGLSNWKSEKDVGLGDSAARGSVGICLMNKGYAYDKNLPASGSGLGKLIYNPNDKSMQRWEKFPKPQIDACAKIAKDIIGAYPITEVIGHHDVAIMGKFDPGPLFDFSPLNALLPSPKPLGLKTKVKSVDGSLNLREEPNTKSKVLQTLANGTPVHVRSIVYGPRNQCVQPSPASRKRYLTAWASISVDDENRHAGFVHMSGLATTPLTPALAAFLK